MMSGRRRSDSGLMLLLDVGKCAGNQREAARFWIKGTVKVGMLSQQCVHCVGRINQPMTTEVGWLERTGGVVESLWRTTRCPAELRHLLFFRRAGSVSSRSSSCEEPGGRHVRAQIPFSVWTQKETIDVDIFVSVFGHLYEC